MLTPEEYLAKERTAPTKSEYIAGEILAMYGGKPPHNMIGLDTAIALITRLSAAGGIYDVHNSDQRVRVEEAGPFFYPDVSVACGTPVFDDDDCLRNPTLIVEVLSESTAAYDRGEKFRNYRRLDSLQDYVLIASDQMRVEHYHRQEGVLWTLAGEYTALEERIILANLAIEVPLCEIYRRVTFV